MVTEEQEEIINSLDKYMLVIAGAGCGKSTTIVKRINELVTKGLYTKKDFLVISFTNATVNDLKEKLPGIDVVTFHKLALKVLGNDVKKIVNDNDLNYYVKEFFLYNLNKKYKRILNRYLNNDKNNLIYFYQRIISVLNIYKANKGNVIKLIKYYYLNIFNQRERDFIRLFYLFLKFYQEELDSYGGYDFNDLIIKASRSKNTIKYKYVIVDEFQDTSLIRLELLNKIVKDNNSSLMVVGDDYQSIYQFSGSNLNIFLNLKNYYSNIKTYYLTETFRNSQELIDVSTRFVLKNKLQLKKIMKSKKHIKRPIKMIYYDDYEKIISELKNKLDSDTMYLGRNKADNRDLDNFYTVHASKGLEASRVVILNNYDGILGFPNQIINDRISKYLINFKELSYGEERRLLYVALTRTKNEVYLLVPINNKSRFIKELERDYPEYIEKRMGL